jgi:hypothetical protein
MVPTSVSLELGNACVKAIGSAQRAGGHAGSGCDLIAYTESKRAALPQQSRAAFFHAVFDEGLVLARRDAEVTSPANAS